MSYSRVKDHACCDLMFASETDKRDDSSITALIEHKHVGRLLYILSFVLVLGVCGMIGYGVPMQVAIETGMGAIALMLVAMLWIVLRRK